MEEPLGARTLKIGILTLIAATIFNPTPVKANAQPTASNNITASKAEGSCAARLKDLISLEIDDVTQNDGKSRGRERRLLHKMHSEIEKRVLAACPNLDSCSEDEIARVAREAIQQVLTENPTRFSFLRGQAVSLMAIGAYVGVTLLINRYTDGLAGHALTALLTAFGTGAVFYGAGAMVDIPLRKFKRSSYRNLATNLHSDPNGRQKNFGQVFIGTQGGLDETEQDGRWTEYTVTNRVCQSASACAPHVGEVPERGLERAALILAKTIFDLDGAFIEIDLSDPLIAEWVQTKYSQWYLNDSNREQFRHLVLENIRKYFKPQITPDPGTDAGHLLWVKYDRIVRAWTAPLASF